jgi:hypothetical protein
VRKRLKVDFHSKLSLILTKIYNIMAISTVHMLNIEKLSTVHSACPLNMLCSRTPAYFILIVIVHLVGDGVGKTPKTVNRNLSTKFSFYSVQLCE